MHLSEVIYDRWLVGSYSPCNQFEVKAGEVETDKEKKARMKAAKKRYNKKMSAARRKRAVQKGAQRVARLLERKLTLQGK